jgi:serine protease inhibitor
MEHNMSVKRLFIIVISTFFLFQCEKDKNPMNIQNSEADTETKPTINLTEAKKMVIKYNNEFGLKLFKTINTSCRDSNIFISPLSVSIALGMALNGANGTTRDEIVTMLNLADLPQKEINESYQQLITLLLSNEEKVLFEIANSIWYDQQRMVPTQEFLGINQQYFFADVLNINFSQADAVDIINNWISNKTHEKIQNMLDYIPPDVVLYLINALYFYGQWLYTFDKDKTEENDFYLLNGSKVRCPLMSQKSEYLYYANDVMQMIDLKYANLDYSMTVVLPTSETDVNSMIDALSTDSWNSWIDHLYQDSVTVNMPKFKTEYYRLLNNDLKVLGMQEAFTPAADFSGITPGGGLWISRVIHKAVIEVNEEGSEAAAATIIEFRESVVPQFQEIYLNRPFMFIIREHKTNTILFIGKIVNPIE